MTPKQKLELTWIGKDQQPQLEPRILIEDRGKSFGDRNSQNMLIHGDNLLALKALEQEFTGKINCIYIDPPYNTGNAFEHYDDGIEHSIWLNLIYQRITILSNLLSNDGLIWITLDDNEVHYCKAILDEVFGRSNFIGTIIWQHSIQGKNDAKTFSLHHNYLLVYSKTEKFLIKKLPRQEKHNINYSNPDNDPKGLWRSGDVRSPNTRENLKYNIITPNGKIIAPPVKGWRWSYENIQEKIASGEVVFSQDETKIIRKIYLDNQEGRVPESIWFGEDAGTTREANTEIKHLFDGDVFATPKPERLIERVIQICTNPNDWVLDSFLGSGTTSAVAHKMGRKWIGVELGDHCDTHCLPRLKKVVTGEDQGGVSKAFEWKGGGGFKYYYLAPSLLQKDKYDNWVIDKSYNPEMLAAAMAKHEGFRFSPDEHVFWKQGQSTEKDFIFTTTAFVTVEYLDKIEEEMNPEETLLICCKAFQEPCESRFTNINIKKIPHMLLGRCEFGKDDYSLNIVNVPLENEPAESVIDSRVNPMEKKGKTTIGKKDKNQDKSDPTLF